MNASSLHPSLRSISKEECENFQMFPTHIPIIPLHFSVSSTPKQTELKKWKSANSSMLHLFPICFLEASEPLNSYKYVPLNPKGE